MVDPARDREAARGSTKYNGGAWMDGLGGAELEGPGAPAGARTTWAMAVPSGPAGSKERAGGGAL